MLEQSHDIQQQLNYLKRKLNEKTTFCNLSNYAKIAEKLSHGNINIQIDSVNKLVSIGNGLTKIWFNITEQTLNNIASVLFQDGSQINGLVTADSLDNAKETPENYLNHAVSAPIFINFVNEVEENYAEKEQKHTTADIYRLNADEEEESLEDILDTFVPVTFLTNTVQNNLLIPVNTTIISYCQDFLTATMIQNSTELQNLLKGQQGQQGQQGPEGKSAFIIWCEVKGYDPNTKEYNDFIDDITADATTSTIASVSTSLAADFVQWAQMSALQDQIAVLEGQVATILGGDTAEAFVDAMNDARTATRDVTQYVSDLLGRFRTHFPRATTAAQNAVTSLRPALVHVPLLSV